jgi:hypothetical protein
MEKLIEFLKLLGIHININQETQPIVTFSIAILVLTIIALLCTLNIFIYLLVLYITDNVKFLEYFKNYKVILKIFYYYKKTRVIYIIIEFIFLVFILSSISWLCLRIIQGIT